MRVLIRQKLFLYFLAFIGLSSPISLSLQASQLENYQVKKCNQNHICILAQSSKGFISMNGEHLSSSQGTLEITDLNTKKRERFSCQSLSYNFKSESFVCDNSDNKKHSILPSLFIDAQLNITKLNANIIAVNDTNHLKKANK